MAKGVSIAVFSSHSVASLTGNRQAFGRNNIGNDENCIAVHVRRGDAGLPRQPFRRYAPLLEYFEAGNITSRDHVFLMSDDQSTIYEAETFYSDYHLTWLDRPRVNLPMEDLIDIFRREIRRGNSSLSMPKAWRRQNATPWCMEIVDLSRRSNRHAMLWDYLLPKQSRSALELGRARLATTRPKGLESISAPKS